jgi:hypothetical protein
VAEGRRRFVEDINRLFARNGIAFDLQPDGRIIRLGPPALRESLQQSLFTSEDLQLNELLETARTKFLDPDPAVRQEGLEKLWDAWERVKTIEPGKDKKAQAGSLLNRVTTNPTFLQELEAEALTLTKIGNTFQIRHSETNKTPITSNEQRDYLFHRLFALIRLLLRSTNRGG